LVLAAGSLVAGFLVRTSSVPLLVSIGLSAVIAVLILAGWSKRLRASGAFDGSGSEEVELEVSDVEEGEPALAEGAEPAEVGTSRASRRLDRKAAARTRARIDERAAERAGSRPGRPVRSRADQTIEIRPTDERRAKRAPKKKKAPTRKPARVKDPIPAAETTAPRPKVAPERSKPSAAKRAPRAKAPAAKPAPARAAKPPKKAPLPKTAPKTSPAKKSGRVLVIPGRSRFHVRGCRFAKGADLREVTEAVARRRGYEPCNICMPDR
jgi:FtsZ-interacting cell division protein ZipA